LLSFINGLISVFACVIDKIEIFLITFT